MPEINKIVDFWWSILHWETRIGHFGVRVDENIKFLKFEVIEATEVVEAVEVIEAAEVPDGKDIIQ